MEVIIISQIISDVFYILIAILVFGLLIFVHELGHFLAARAFKVRVNEFALGMGPAIIKKQKGETLYALRAFPVGGFCAMEGEDEDSDDPSSLGTKPIWQRSIIMIAGAAMNFILGIIILLSLYMPVQSYIEPSLSAFDDGFPYQGETMLMKHDLIKSINGYPIYVYSNVIMFLDRGTGAPYDIVVERNGKRIELFDIPIEKREYLTEIITEDGTKQQMEFRYGFSLTRKDAGFSDRVRLAMLETVDFVRMIKLSFFDLFQGKASVGDMSGPVGIATVITNTAKYSFAAMWKLVALIAINLGVMNLLPLPALDGGRVMFLLIEKVKGSPINPRYEGAIHFAGLAALLIFMVFISYNDIMRLITG